MKPYVIKLIFLVILLAIIAYFNYPSFSSFFSTNNTIDIELIKEKHSLSKEIIEPLYNLNIALPDIENDRIEILSTNSIDQTIKDNKAIKFIIEDNFQFEEEEGKLYLKQTNFSNEIFISDYAKRINKLLENVKKIKSIELDLDQQSILFVLEEEKRLSLESDPITVIFGEEGYDWIYDKITSSYIARISLPDYLLSLGLDLQGGTYLDVGVDLEDMLKNLLIQTRSSVSRQLEKEGISIDEIYINEENQIIIEKGTLTRDRIDFNSDQFNNIVSSYDIKQTDNQVILTIDDNYLASKQADLLNQAITIIRDRIDLLGVKDPTIQKRGRNSIVVQVPGKTDSTRIKELITQPANLEFRLVSDEQDSTEDSITLYSDTLDPVTKEVISSVPVIVEEQIIMKGDVITDARVAFDQFTGAPQISFSLNTSGANQFGEITEANVGRSLAIILDEKVRSFPRINQAIYGGQGSITGQFSVDEARDLAIILRSGALPTSLSIEEERVVSASLGEDSIVRSLYSFIIGFTILALFLIIYYRISGLIAIFALSLNLLLILAVLAYFQATLTLPGIAGIILTIAMAVDANILIYERIREELAHEASYRKAVQQGFRRVAVTILDSNITTLLIAAVLFQFGTGPIRGFAVTLAIGIFSTIFTSLVVSHWIFDIVYLRKQQLSKISI